MSFIIKGMDLSKDEVITFHYLNEQGEMVFKIIDKSDAIQIPKEHGRIGDFDLLKDMIRDSVPAYGIGVKIPTYGDMDIMDKIEFMPTILEAEE